MKLPFSFDIKFLFRVILPGFILSLGFIPLIELAIKFWGIQLKIEYFVALFAIIFGWLFIVCDMHIYMCLEGRRYWPSSLRKYLINKKIKKLNQLLSDLKASFNKSNKLPKGTAEHAQAYNRYIELSVKYRMYPVDEDGNRVIKFPTTLGNAIYAYENYPYITYGMDSIFYWYRIWLKLDKDLRHHLDGQQGLADSSVYSTFSLIGLGSLFALYAVLSMSTSIFDDYSVSTGVFAIISIASLLLAVILYRVSLQSHESCFLLLKI